VKPDDAVSLRRATLGAPRLTALAAMGAVWGPGLLVMLADTDAGNIITAADAGARWGYRLLPLPLLLIPALAMVQDLAVRIGIFTGRGFGDLIRERLGRPWRWLAALALTAATLGSLITDLTGVAGVGELYGVPRPATLALAGLCLLLVMRDEASRRPPARRSAARTLLEVAPQVDRAQVDPPVWSRSQFLCQARQAAGVPSVGLRIGRQGSRHVAAGLLGAAEIVPGGHAVGIDDQRPTKGRGGLAPAAGLQQRGPEVMLHGRVIGELGCSFGEGLRGLRPQPSAEQGQPMGMLDLSGVREVRGRFRGTLQSRVSAGQESGRIGAVQGRVGRTQAHGAIETPAGFGDAPERQKCSPASVMRGGEARVEADSLAVGFGRSRPVPGFGQDAAERRAGRRRGFIARDGAMRLMQRFGVLPVLR